MLDLPGAHGGLDVVSALQESCNVFFYTVGYDLGIDDEGNYDSELGIQKLAEYAQMFGLGETSGVEIPESDPQILMNMQYSQLSDRVRTTIQ